MRPHDRAAVVDRPTRSCPPRLPLSSDEDALEGQFRMVPRPSASGDRVDCPPIPPDGGGYPGADGMGYEVGPIPVGQTGLASAGVPASGCRPRGRR